MKSAPSTATMPYATPRYANVGIRPDALHQLTSRRRGNQGASAKTSDGDAGDQAAAFRKPFDENGYGNYITQAQSEPSDHAIGEVQQPQFVGGEARQKNAAAPEDTACHRDDSGPASIHPEPTEDGRAAQHKPTDGER